tara:strand:+ start:217 stop:468 length:252 start_codon:yes stop_codon:yes gene_type:complete
MGYVSKTKLRPNIITKNGAETISFIATACTVKLEDVNFATAYFNPVTGLFDDTKSTLSLTNSIALLIDQAYTVTSAELIALNT